MANATIKIEEFEKIEDVPTKLNILFRAIVDIRRRQRFDDLKAIAGGFMGGFAAMFARFEIWK